MDSPAKASLFAKHGGLIHIYTGNGKGKTSAAFGTCLRALGRGGHVAIFQFFKTFLPGSGERLAMESMPFPVDVWVYDYASFASKGAREEVRRTQATFEKGYTHALKALHSGEYDLVLLDEVIYALHQGLIDLADFIAELKRRPQHVEVILTGRRAPEALIEAADYVTHLEAVKHPLQKGIKARRGAEF